MRVVGRATGADDLRGVVGVGAPEVQHGGLVPFGDDALGEAEGLERLDAAGLEAVRLPDLEPSRTPFDQTRGDTRVLRHLGREDHARGAGPDDQYVDLVGQVGGAVESGAGGGLDPRIGGHIAMVVKLHRNS